MGREVYLHPVPGAPDEQFQTHTLQIQGIISFWYITGFTWVSRFRTGRFFLNSLPVETALCFFFISFKTCLIRSYLPAGEVNDAPAVIRRELIEFLVESRVTRRVLLGGMDQVLHSRQPSRPSKLSHSFMAISPTMETAARKKDNVSFVARMIPRFI